MAAATLIKYCNPVSCRTKESPTPLTLINYALNLFKSVYLWFICMPQLLRRSLRTIFKHRNTQNGSSLGSWNSCKINKSVCHNVWLVNANYLFIYFYIESLLLRILLKFLFYETLICETCAESNNVSMFCSDVATHKTAAGSWRQHWGSNSNGKYWRSYANFGHPASGLRPIFYYATHLKDN